MTHSTYTGTIRTLKFLPTQQNQLITAGAGDCAMRCWDFTKETKNPLHIWKGHEAPVFDIDMMSRSNLVSCSQDRTLRIWDIRAGGKNVDITQTSTSINAVSASYSMLSTAHADGSVAVWDTRSLSHPVLNFSNVHHHEVRSVQFCPHDESWILTASFDGTVRVLSSKTQSITMKWSDHDGKVLRAQWGGGINFVSCSADRTVRVWE